MKDSFIRVSTKIIWTVKEPALKFETVGNNMQKLMLKIALFSLFCCCFLANDYHISRLV